jgi:hypothetical protein
MMVGVILVFDACFDVANMKAKLTRIVAARMAGFLSLCIWRKRILIGLLIGCATCELLYNNNQLACWFTPAEKNF